MALAWMFLSKYWKLLLLAAAIAIALGYVETLRLEVDHYKTKAGDLELEIATAKQEQKKETERQQLAFDSITKQHLATLRNKGTEITNNFNKVVNQIKAHEASKHVVITPDVVSLFNATTGPQAEPAPTEQGNAGKAAALEETVNALEHRNGQLSVTLNDLLLVSADNNANHLKCIAQVEDWQKFWEDYVSAKTPRPTN